MTSSRYEKSITESYSSSKQSSFKKSQRETNSVPERYRDFHTYTLNDSSELKNLKNNFYNYNEASALEDYICREEQWDLLNDSTEARRNRREKRGKEFVPSFALIDVCQTNDERKVKVVCTKLSTLPEVDVIPVINCQDAAGRTPLSYASGGGSIQVVEELSRIKCIDPNLGDNDGNTPLHYASQAGHSEVVDLMIARFGNYLDLNCRNSTGLTPLMKSALQGRTRCAKSLLAAGAVANLRDYSRGLTAAEWAKLCGRHICSEVIIRSAKEAQRHSTSSSMNFPTSRSNMELRRMNSDESPYYHLYGRSTLSGANWLKNKIKKALTGTATSSSSTANKRPPISEGSYTLMGGATICAGSLLLPSIKPLVDQQRQRHSVASKKLSIPTLQVTPVKR